MTKLIEWSDDLSVGIQEIDEQHKVLVNLVNEMHDAVKGHDAGGHAMSVLDMLVDYTRIHFAVEESLMRIFEYPKYADHKQQHEQLLREVLTLRAELQSGKERIGLKLLHFLRMWLANHIQESDKDYTPYMLKGGAKAKSSNQSWFARLWA
jgi:hemerythrin